MTGLDADIIAQYKQQLLEKRQTLLDLQATSSDASQTVELDQTSVGRLSRMDALQGQAMSKERERRREVEVQKINAALGRIESGVFGYCASCDELIASKRLDFDPSAALCIDCANKADTGIR
jgi:DnaK suppressor protein